LQLEKNYLILDLNELKENQTFLENLKIINFKTQQQKINYYTKFKKKK